MGRSSLYFVEGLLGLSDHCVHGQPKALPSRNALDTWQDEFQKLVKYTLFLAGLHHHVAGDLSAMSHKNPPEADGKVRLVYKILPAAW